MGLVCLLQIQSAFDVVGTRYKSQNGRYQQVWSRRYNNNWIRMYENSLLLLGLRKCFRFLTPEKAVCFKIIMEFCNFVVTFTTPPL